MVGLIRFECFLFFLNGLELTVFLMEVDMKSTTANGNELDCI